MSQPTRHLRQRAANSLAIEDCGLTQSRGRGRLTGSWSTRNCTEARSCDILVRPLLADKARNVQIRPQRLSSTAATNRPTTMDYSSSIQEADDPVTGSPWGNSPGSSPQANRTGFGNLTGDPPSSPFGRLNTQASSNGEGDGQRPGTATTASVTDGETEGETATDHSVAESTVGSQSISGDHSEPASQPGDPDAQPGPGQQARKPPQPQYRLQAKITGLERTGKKDPVLRFDVHVRSLPASYDVGALRTDAILDQPASIPHHTVPRCSTSSFRIH